MKKRALFMVGTVLGILILMGVSTLSESCEPGVWLPPSCDGDTKVIRTCQVGVVITNREECSIACSYGLCFSEINESYCASQHAAVEVSLLLGLPQTDIAVCEENEYCNPDKGGCEQIIDSCGDGVCSGDEDINNCYKDCWSLSDWDKFYRVVETKPELQPMLESLGEFDFNDPVVDEIISEIKSRYDTSTPYKYQLAVTDFVSKFGDYDRAGGVAQCNEPIITLIKRKEADGSVWMNCVDYSAMMVGLLRHEGIPSRQVAGCVTHFTTWRCRPYAFTTPMLRAGNINEVQPLGHAWVELFIPEFGWQVADPTIGVSVGRDCIGYSQAYDYGGTADNPGNVCYIPNYDAIEECRAF